MPESVVALLEEVQAGRLRRQGGERGGQAAVWCGQEQLYEEVHEGCLTKSRTFHRNYPRALLNRVGPRNLLHTLASDVDDPTVEPRWGKVGSKKSPTRAAAASSDVNAPVVLRRAHRLVLLGQMRHDVHARGFEPHEEWLVLLLRLVDELQGLVANDLVDGFHVVRHCPDRYPSWSMPGGRSWPKPKSQSGPSAK